jgi:hypothetical protein
VNGETQQRQVTETIKEILKINRNDTVTIQNVANGQTQEMKYKKESLIATGQWVVVKSNSFLPPFFKAVKIAAIIQSPPLSSWGFFCSVVSGAVLSYAATICCQTLDAGELL